MEASAEQFAHRLAALTHSTRPGGLRKTSTGRRLFFIAGDGGGSASKELSASEQQAVIFAATALFIGLAPSVVLVDAPEKHLRARRCCRSSLALASSGRTISSSSPPAVASSCARRRPQAVIRLGS